MARRLISLFLATALLVAIPALAQTVLVDPTRPPPGMTADRPETQDAPAGTLLQSIIIPKKGKPVAVIGGQQVRVGETFGDSRLIKLTEKEAVLEGPAGVEHLLLTPGVEKTNITRISRNSTKTPVAKAALSGSKP